MSNLNNIPNSELFDSKTNMLAVNVDRHVYHRIYLTAEYAVDLVTDGSIDCLERAEKVISAVLDCQELHQDDPHYGNFFWEKEEGIVEDLNAVEFVLIRFIPIMLRYPERLSPQITTRLKMAIRIALDEIARIDVNLVYTNIVAQDVVNSILGGQLLADEQYIKRGMQKLEAWQALIDRNGIPHEYNSPVYSTVTIKALSHLVDLATDQNAQMIAKLIMARLGISLALHLHPKTKRLAGPHCRAYYQFLTYQTVAEFDIVTNLIAQNQLPDWIQGLLENRPENMTITETSDAEAKVSIGTYHGKSFSLGVATRELDTQSNRYISNQSNVFSVQYTRGDDTIPGIVYSRYLLNDKWLGDYRTTLSRGNRDVFFDEGSFRGVQAGARSINMLAPLQLGAWERCFSAKACLIWHDRSDVDEIWIDGTEITELPLELNVAQVIVIGCGDIYVAIRPLDLTDLGRNAPIRLVEREESLVLELYNYLGAVKTFWELARPGAFYQGRPKCGFYAEVAEKSDYQTGRDFAAVISNSELVDDVGSVRTYDGQNERVWSVKYNRDGQELGIDLDLMQFEIKRHWTHDTENAYPMLESPIAVEALGGAIMIGDATLTCGMDAGWLVALPDVKLWVAGYHGPTSAPLILDIPDGRIEIESLTKGIIVWNKGEVSIDAIDLVGTPIVIGGQLI